MQHRPEQVVRYTVEQNGGEYTTTVLDLMSLFGRKELTDLARSQIRRALLDQDVAADPDLLEADESAEVRLFLVKRASVGAPIAPAPSAPGWGGRLRPRTWKGWTAYAITALVILAVVVPDSEKSGDTRPAADTVIQKATGNDAEDQAAVRAQVQEEREKLRKQRAQLRRERAQARRERARARRARAAGRRERERELQRQEEAAATEPEPEPAANCHPSYDPCLDPNASDYDCAGGSGDGPEYTGYVTVKGPDEYDLDSDGDGTGCES